MREKQDTIECGMTCTAEGDKHQVINTICKRHVQAQGETDKAVGQKYDWSREVAPQEFPAAKLYIGSKMTASVPSLFWITRGHVAPHTNHRRVCFTHERYRQDSEDSAEHSNNLSRVSFASQVRRRWHTDENIFVSDCLHYETGATVRPENSKAGRKYLTLRQPVQ